MLCASVNKALKWDLSTTDNWWVLEDAAESLAAGAASGWSIGVGASQALTSEPTSPLLREELPNQPSKVSIPAEILEVVLKTLLVTWSKKKSRVHLQASSSEARSTLQLTKKDSPIADVLAGS